MTNNLSKRPQNINFGQRSKIINNQQKNKREQEYLKNPNKCGNLKCTNPNLTYEQRHYKHCSKSCSAIVSNAKRSYDFQTAEYKKNISDTLKSKPPRSLEHNMKTSIAIKKYHLRKNPKAICNRLSKSILNCKNEKCNKIFTQKNLELYCTIECRKEKMSAHSRNNAAKRIVRSNKISRYLY